MSGALAVHAPIQAEAARGVAPSGGASEHEADRAAEHVAAGGSVAGWPFSAVPASPPDPGAAPVDGALARSGGGLEPETRRFMEAGFGRSFADVRVHADATSTAALGAHAYTAGRDLVFAPGRYRPDTANGRHLLAHELAHVVQQRRSSSPGPIQRYTAYSPAKQTSGRSKGWRHPTTGKIRVSDDGQMAVDDLGWGAGTNKRGWTTPALVAASNSILDAQGSHGRLRAKPGGDTIAGHAPEGGAASTLTEIEPFTPGGSGPFSLIADCGTACRQIIGSGPVGTKDVAVLRREARPGSKGTGGAIAGGIIGLLGGAVGGALLGARYGGFWGGLILGVIGGLAGLFGGKWLGRRAARSDPEGAGVTYSTPQTYHKGPPSTPEDFSGELYQRELGGATHTEALQRYAALSADERTEFDRRHGINRFARPRVGEGITIGTEVRMPGFATLASETWNFHYAAAVLDSGHDYMTLESAAGWGVHDWIFYMYGPPSKEQTFHEEHLEMESHGTKATSLVVQPEARLDVSTKAPDTTLRTDTGTTITLPAGQTLRVLERRTPFGGTEEVRVRVVSGPDHGVEGWIPAAAI